eukprot:SAG22_NODE_783_length_7251_cov_18.263423_9_plen_170_part_00
MPRPERPGCRRSRRPRRRRASGRRRRRGRSLHNQARAACEYAIITRARHYSCRALAHSASTCWSHLQSASHARCSPRQHLPPRRRQPCRRPPPPPAVPAASSVLVAEYRQGGALASIKARLDAHMARRGTWQKAMFVVYYKRFELELPPSTRTCARAARGPGDRTCCSA